MYRLSIWLIIACIAAFSVWTLTATAQGEMPHHLFAPLVYGVPPLPTATPTPPPTATPSADYRAEILRLTNEQRATNGCPPLTMEDHLMNAAQGHSQDMADNDIFSHTGSDGSSPWDRMAAAGYGGYSYAAENIAGGYGTPALAMNAWMNSPAHRANILNCGLREIGVGYAYRNPDPGNINYRHYWTQVFATPR